MISLNEDSVQAHELETESKIPGFVTPQYEGKSISNIPDTIAKFLELRSDRPISNEAMYQIEGNVSKVVFLLLDGFGYDSIVKGVAAHGLPSVKSLLQDSIYFPLTSVFPSTTSTATTTLHSGLTPQEHGVIGYSMFFKDFGTIADTLRFTPLVGGRNSLFNMGLDPDSFIGSETIHEKLQSQGIRSNLYINKWIVNSGLSEITCRGANIIPHLTAPDMFAQLRKNLIGSSKESFHFAYYASPDTVAHARGPFTDGYAAEIESLFQCLKSEILEKIDAVIAKEIVLIISADHGLCQIDDDNIIDIQRHPNLLDLLSIPPTGDSRCLFLHARPGMEDAIRSYFETNFPRQFYIMTTKEAISAGLFGHGKTKKGLEEVIGELIAVPLDMIAVDNSLLDPREKSVPGRHGGLHRNEMIVPLIAKRLGNKSAKAK